MLVQRVVVAMDPQPGRGLEVSQRRILKDKTHRQYVAVSREQRAKIPHTFLQSGFPVDEAVIDNEFLEPTCEEQLWSLARCGVRGIEEERKEVDDLAELEPRRRTLLAVGSLTTYRLTVSSARVGMMPHGGSPTSGSTTASVVVPR